MSAVAHRLILLFIYFLKKEVYFMIWLKILVLLCALTSHENMKITPKRGNTCVQHSSESLDQWWCRVYTHHPTSDENGHQSAISSVLGQFRKVHFLKNIVTPPWMSPPVDLGFSTDRSFAFKKIDHSSKLIYGRTPVILPFFFTHLYLMIHSKVFGRS